MAALPATLILSAGDRRPVTDTLPPEPPSHYRDGKERLADLIVHLTGLALALVGGGMLLGLAIGFGDASGWHGLAVLGIVVTLGIGMLLLLWWDVRVVQYQSNQPMSVQDVTNRYIQAILQV